MQINQNTCFNHLSWRGPNAKLVNPKNPQIIYTILLYMISHPVSIFHRITNDKILLLTHILLVTSSKLNFDIIFTVGQRYAI